MFTIEFLEKQREYYEDTAFNEPWCNNPQWKQDALDKIALIDQLLYELYTKKD